MSNVIKTLLAIALMAATLLAACGDNSRRTQAQALLDQARGAAADRQYPRAIELLDTLDRAYRDCLDVRRAGTVLRTEALRDLTIDSIAANEARLQTLQTAVDRSASYFAHVDVAGTDGYMVYTPAAKSWQLDRTGLQARIDPEGYFFIVVNVAGRAIGLDRICLGDVCTVPAQSVAVEGSEIMNISQEQALPLVQALLSAQAPASITLRGTRGNIPLTLDAKALDALRATWQYAQARQQLRLNLIGRERLERQLARLRETLANLATDSLPAD